ETGNITWSATQSGNQTYTGSGTAVSSSTGPGTVTSTYGPQAATSNDSATVNTTDTYNYSSFFSATYRAGLASDSFSDYRAGSFAGGSFNLGSTLYQEDGTATWSYAANSNQTYHGAGSATTVGTSNGQTVITTGGSSNSATGTTTV